MKIVNWKYIQRVTFIVGVCVAIILSIVFMSGLSGNWPIVVFTIVFVPLSHVVTLQVRIESTDRGKWNVVLNGTNVGTISDSDYANINWRVITNWRNYVAQFLKLGHVVVEISIPFFIIVLGIAIAACFLYMVSPDMITAAITEFIAMGSTILHVFVVFYSILISLLFLITGLDFISRFRDDETKILRQQLGITAEGNLTLSRCADELAPLPTKFHKENLRRKSNV